MRQNKRRLFVGLFFAVAVPLGIASVAYACQRITPLHANPDRGAAGSQVRVTGTNYSSQATSSNIEIRLDTRNGRSLASISPTSLEPVGRDTGKFDITLTIPSDVAIGNHILIATQTLANGRPCVGCPGRANFEVTGAAAQASSNQTAAGPAAAQRDQSSEAPAGSEPSGYSEPAAAPAQTAPAQAAPAQASPASAPAATDNSKASAAPAGASNVSTAPVAPASAPVVASDAAATVSEAAPVVAEAPAVASEPAPAPAPAIVGLVPASSSPTPSPLPRFALAAGLALVLLGLAAFWKSGRAVLGGRTLTPAAG